MLRSIVFLLFIGLSYPSLSDVPQNTYLEYGDGNAVFSYSGLISRLGLATGAIAIRKCYSPPDDIDRCATNNIVRTEVLNSSSSFEIDSPGIYRISIYGKKDFQVFYKVVWIQFVAVLENSDAEITGLAAKHSPLYSFHDEEEYYPVTLSEIYDLPLQNYKEDGENRSKKYQEIDKNVDLASEYIRYNGHAKHEITLDKDVAREITGNKNNFPVYWFHEKTSDLEMYITYITFYGYDKKYDDYVNLASFGDHAVDRESITIRFTRSSHSGGWMADSVYYAGHLPNQETTFRGCSNSDICDQAGNGDESFATTWRGGKTRMVWSTVARLGERPIVYVAHGSHAHTPGYGYYDLDVPVYPGIDYIDVSGGQLDVEEPSGSVNRNSINRAGRLVEIDMAQDEFTALVLSGYAVKGPNSWYRMHPFIRNPIGVWVQNAGVEFSACVLAQRGCEDYIHRAEDTDGDGVPDESDDFPFDPIFQNDIDGDGVPDERDAFPNDPIETTDLNNDGFGDNAVPVDGLTRFTGNVLDLNGNPIPRAVIQIELIQSEFAQDGVIQTRTNNLGDFLIQSDLSVLPNSFAISISSPLHIPDVFIVTKSTLGSGLQFVLQDIVLEDSNLNTIVIEPNPVLHHLGDDDFRDAINSQFQRSSEGIEYNRVFTVTDNQMVNQNFTFTLSSKGIQSVDEPTSFSFNGNSVISFPQGDIDGNYTEEAFTLSISEHLIAGENTLKILSGYKADTGDYDDFEFINPIASFNTN